MKVATIKKRDVAKELTKGYMKLLTQVAANGIKAVDDYFFDNETEEDSDIKPYFYGSIAFGIAVTLLIFVIVR